MTHLAEAGQTLVFEVIVAILTVLELIEDAPFQWLSPAFGADNLAVQSPP